jgi:hypothetical protein
MLASRLAVLITPPAPGNVERFVKGMEMTSRKEFWTETAPTRKGRAARATVVEKYI